MSSAAVVSTIVVSDFLLVRGFIVDCDSSSAVDCNADIVGALEGSSKIPTTWKKMRLLIKVANGHISRAVIGN